VQDNLQEGGTGRQVKRPLHIADASVDDKGRLKVPVDFAEYLESFGGKNLFITTLDERVGLIYPESKWESNMDQLWQSGNLVAAKQTDLVAKAYGGGAEIGEASRALLPANFRKKLGITGKTQVFLNCLVACVQIFTEEVYEQMLTETRVMRAETMAHLDKIGFTH
jgi:MraZ protein